MFHLSQMKNCSGGAITGLFLLRVYMSIDGRSFASLLPLATHFPFWLQLFLDYQCDLAVGHHNSFFFHCLLHVAEHAIIVEKYSLALQGLLTAIIVTNVLAGPFCTGIHAF